MYARNQAAARRADRRYCVRQPLRLSVEVRTQRRPVGRFQTRDMDAEGAFIEGAGPQIHVNDIIELVFLNAAGEATQHVLLAGVVRVATDGAGVVLLDNECKALTVMRDSSLLDMPAA